MWGSSRLPEGAGHSAATVSGSCKLSVACMRSSGPCVSVSRWFDSFLRAHDPLHPQFSSPGAKITPVFYHLYIKPSWVVSPRARRVYLAASCLSIYFFVLFIAVSAIIESTPTAIDLPNAVAAFIRVQMYLGVLGMAVLWIGMAYYWYGFDSSNSWLKAVTLLILLLGPLGAVLYQFLIYRRQTRTPKHTAASAATSS